MKNFKDGSYSRCILCGESIRYSSKTNSWNHNKSAMHSAINDKDELNIKLEIENSFALELKYSMSSIVSDFDNLDDEIITPFVKFIKILDEKVTIS